MTFSRARRRVIPMIIALALVAGACGNGGTDSASTTLKTRPDAAQTTLKAPPSTTTTTMLTTTVPTTVPSTTTTMATTTTTEFSCAGLCAKISNLIEDDGELIVQWETFNYEPSTANFHAHFFFDIYEAKAVGTNFAENGASARGSWQLTDDQPFFTKGSSVAISHAPDGATKLCVVAADSGHGVVNPENFDCVPLPGMEDAMEDEEEDAMEDESDG